MNDPAIIAQCQRWQNRALILGVLAAIVSLIGLFVSRTQFFQSYLIAWLFWCGLSLGALVIVMMQFLSGGLWGLAIRNFSTAGFRTLPWMAVLFLPVLLGVHQIFGWSNGANGEAPGYHHKAQYLNVPFFTARALVYFCVLIAIAFILRRMILAQAGAKIVPTRLTVLCIIGLIAYVLCMNFAATDWVMSLDPKWFSTIFVIVFAAGQFLSALALMTALLCAFANHLSPITNHAPIPQKAFHDLGGMLMAFVIFWAYVSFSQFLIIWSGNLPKEIGWYLERSHGGWQWLAVALVALQFFLPFFLLLSRVRKSNPNRLARICLLILFANVLNNFWLVAPSFHPEGFYLHWLDLTAWFALGGFWFALFFYFLKRQPLLATELLEARQNG